MIDLTYLEEVSGGDESFIDEMLRMFLDQTLPEINNLGTILQTGDMVVLASGAHRIKSAVQMLGNPDASTLIKNIEQAAKENQPSKTISTMIQQLEKVSHDISDFIIARQSKR